MFKIRHAFIVIAAVCALMVTPASHAQIIQDILSKATAARNNAASARDHAQDIRQEMQEALQTLTADMRSFINDFIDEASRIIAEEKEGRDEFVNGPACGTFRQDLVSMLQHMEVIFNQLNLIADPNATPISFADEIQLINQIPCKVLYPLYRVMVATNAFGSHMLDLLEEGATALQTVGAIVTAHYTDVPGESLDYELGQFVNQQIIDNPKAADDAKFVVQGLGMVLKIAGKRLNSKAQKGVDTVQIEIWGWVGLTLKSDPKSKWGEILVGLSEMLNKVSESAGSNIDHAMLIGSLGEIRDNQLEILQNQATIIGLLQNKNP